MYCYHRRTGTRIAAEYGTAAFFLELAALDKARDDGKPLAGTFGHLVATYLTSPEFIRLKPRTKADYEFALAFLKPLDVMPLGELSRALVIKLRNDAFAAHKRRFANSIVQVISGCATSSWSIIQHPVLSSSKNRKMNDGSSAGGRRLK